MPPLTYRYQFIIMKQLHAIYEFKMSLFTLSETQVDHSQRQLGMTLGRSRVYKSILLNTNGTEKRLKKVSIS